MERFAEESKSSMLVFFNSYVLKYVGNDFVFNPIFIRGVSGSLHFALLLFLFISWLWKKFKAYPREVPKQSIINASFRCYKIVLFFCLSLTLFNLVLCFLNHFYWYKSGWSREKVTILSDLALKTLAWLAISVCLYTQIFNSGRSNFPLVLKVWCALFFSLSCCSLLVDFISYKMYKTSPIQFWFPDMVSTSVGLFFCVAWFFIKNEVQNTPFQEPLLNEITSNGKKCDDFKSIEMVTPYSTANFFSILTFSWMGPLIATGRQKILDLEDVPQLDSIDNVDGVFLVLKEKLDSYSGGTNQVSTIMLVKALMITTWKDCALTAIFVLIFTFASYVGPYLIDNFVQFLNGSQSFKYEGYFYVFAFLAAKLFECLAQRHWFFKVQQAGMRARSALVAQIYNKGLTLSCQSKQGQTSGEIINYMAVDAERIGDFAWYMHDPWMVIVQVSLALIILYKNLGLASLAAFASVVVVMLANVPLGKLQEKFQEKLMESKDKRMKATSEILRNMRILKLQSWEMKFLSKIMDIRNIEEGWLKKYVYTAAMVTFVFWGAPTFVAVITFVSCMLMGTPLESGKILSALATFRILQEPIYNLPDTISMIVQTKVSLDRIASFLRLDDLQPDIIEKLPRSSTDMAIEIVDGRFSWDFSSPNPTLRDINVRILHGKRVAVCGTIGSGKSSFLSCILGEIPKLSGTIRLSGTKAYVSQTPWIQSGKIVENILFGKKMDRQRYEKVLEACSLKKDLEILSCGDQTIIGERGINLSGGQKQRVQIARALYQDADIYLFDDPFSALDAHTGNHLFKECLLGFLESKTVIYVTHQVEFLPSADLIMVMKNGKITQAGKYSDILNLGGDFLELVSAHEEALAALEPIEEGKYSTKVNDNEENSSGQGDKIILQRVESRVGENDELDDKNGLKGQLVQEEEREKGSVVFSVYLKYITTAYGGALVPFILLAQILFQLLQIGSNYWMAWATPITWSTKPPVSGGTLIIVYVALALTSAFCILVRALLLAMAGYKTATLLFNKMHYFLFRAPMAFFDSTPSGRILNRASTDQSAVDLNMAYLFGAFAFSMIQLLGIIAVMSQVAWQVFIVFIPVIAVCIFLQRYYIPSARELARLIGVSKAPIIQHYSETLSGSTTIRSFEQESRFQETSKRLIDEYSRPKFHTAGAMEWLCFRLDMLSSVTFAFSLFFLISIPEGSIEPSIAGLAVTYGLNLNMLQAWVIWNLCTLENKIISVERILQYTSIPSEPPLIESNRPDSLWPSHGEVDISNLQVRYAQHMPLVLRGLTFRVFGGKKTGIVGRTGSGKSTLIQTLFRIVEPAAGHILIDGINICSIGLQDLRSRLSIIPQDPTMFEGSVRTNLDPLEEYSDEQIWEALDKCQLGDEVRKKERKLDSTVTENGENWSVGQRQLVCLGRVLLKKSKVLVLDEATASVDTATDNLIQQALRQHFLDSTVITIAHRITSVLDSDMVLLLDHGLIREYDSPTMLLKNKSSSFAKLVSEYSMRSNSEITPN